MKQVQEAGNDSSFESFLLRTRIAAEKMLTDAWVHSPPSVEFRLGTLRDQTERLLAATTRSNAEGRTEYARLRHTLNKIEEYQTVLRATRLWCNWKTEQLSNPLPELK